jgi:hypothetical protein
VLELILNINIKVNIFVARRDSVKLLIIVILLVVLVPTAYAGLQFYSIKAAKISITNPRVDFGITDLLDIQGTLMDILLSRELDGEFDLQFEGNGVLPVQVRSIQSKVFLEDVYVGSFVSNDFFMIPAQGTETAHMDFKIDLTQIGLSEVEQFCSSVLEHNGEIKISIEALMEPIIIVFPITMPVTETKYILTFSDAPQVTSLIWNAPSCEINDQVSFTSTVTNVFRDSEVAGYLDIEIREDVDLGFDVTVDTFSYPIELDPGESISVSDSFTPYKESSTRGFFLKAYWGTSSIEEQSSSYPPRLRVIEGTLDVEEVYWTVSGVIISSCEVDDVVQAHIKLGALNAALDDDIVIKVRKDLALSLDTDVLTQNHHIFLERDQDTEIVISFSPTEASSILLRGYFIEIEGDTQWTMSDEYPPRLTVSGGGASQGTLSVTNVWWIKSGSSVTSSEYGDSIEAKVTVRAIGGPFSGVIDVNVNRDLAFSFDDTYASSSFSVSLDEGEQRTYTVTFIASEVSGSSFRGYFIEVDGDASWTMSSTYPPRLIVNEPYVPEVEGYPIVQNTWWTVGGYSVSEVSQGQSVKAIIRILSVDGSSKGDVRVHIRKDLAYQSDEDLMVNSYEIDLGEDEYADIEITFTASEKSGFTFRGYFIQVDFLSWGNEWTMSSSYPPRLKVN